MNGNPIIPEIKLANVVSGVAAVDSSEKGVSETFVGLIQTSSDKSRAYIKVLDARQLVNELIRVNVGYELGLQSRRNLLDEQYSAIYLSLACSQTW